MLNVLNKFKNASGLGPLSRRLKAWVVEQPRLVKRWIIMGIDFLCLLLLMSGLIYVRSFLVNGFEAPSNRTIFLLFFLPFLSVGAFRFLGLYRLVTRHVGRKGFWRIGY